MFSLRIVNVDHYMCPPKSGIDLTYSQFRGNQVKYVPVIRIFGATPSGAKACLHIHGVFPYILVPFSGTGEAGRFLYQLASSLDKAINVSLGTSFSQKQHVFKIVQVSGRPFYGYHGQNHQYLKIFFYNPLIIKRASDLLQNGAVCGTQFQIHESHVPFILQFFIDYNLYGMSFINLKSVVYRKEANLPGEASETLAKQSFCEIEADGVAVDILNRLTVEGELAVNPGLAAIWKEEQERLQKDVLESSQRPSPQQTMSEVLLMDKLLENLRFEGKCTSSLKEKIPYPAETQKSSGNEFLDASVLDTHSVSSLISSKNPDDDIAVVDEELALSLSQTAITSNSLDQSLLMALDMLAAPQEELAAAMALNVEDDSVLGSQMFPKEDDWDENVNVDDLAAVDYSLPPDFDFHIDEDKNEEDSDDNFEVNIPQLDGVGDIIFNEKKKSIKRKRNTFIENIVSENNFAIDVEDSLVNDLKDSDCWPELGRQESMDEIFSDEEPFNSPMHNFEDNNIVEEEPLNIEIRTSLDTVLRGDPSLTCEDVASSEDTFLSMPKNDFTVWNTNTEDICSKKYLFDASTVKNKPTDSISDVNTVDCEPPVDRWKDVCDSNNSSTIDLDKQMTLPSFSDDLLNTCQLDEIFNEDLNKGLDIMCENNSQPESTKSPFHEPCNTEILSLRDQMEGARVSQLTVADDQLSTSLELSLCNNSIVSSDLSRDQRRSTCVSKSILPSGTKDTQYRDNSVWTSSEPSVSPSISPKTKLIRKKSNGATSEKIKVFDNLNLKTKSSNSTPTKKLGMKRRLIIKMFEKKINRIFLSHNDSFYMNDDEIAQYFSQLEYLAARNVDQNDPQNSKPLLWTPIRTLTENNNCKKVKVNNSPKLKKIVYIKNFSKQEITNFSNCFVRLKLLSRREVKDLCRQYNLKINLSLLNKRKSSKSKLQYLKQNKGKKSLKSKNKIKRNLFIEKSNENVNSNFHSSKTNNVQNTRLHVGTKCSRKPIVISKENTNLESKLKQNKKETRMKNKNMLSYKNHVNISNDVINCNILEALPLNSSEFISAPTNKSIDPATSASDNNTVSLELTLKNDTLNCDKIKKPEETKKKVKQCIKRSSNRIVDKDKNNKLFLIKDNNGPNVKVKRDTRTRKSIVFPETKNNGESAVKQPNQEDTLKKQNILSIKRDVFICQDFNNCNLKMEDPSLNSSESISSLGIKNDDLDTSVSEKTFSIKLASKNDSMKCDNLKKSKEIKKKVKQFSKIANDHPVHMSKSNNLLLPKDDNVSNSKIKRHTKTSKSLVFIETKNNGESAVKKINKEDTSKEQIILYNKRDGKIFENFNKCNMMTEDPSLHSSVSISTLCIKSSDDLVTHDSENYSASLESVPNSCNLKSDLAKKTKENRKAENCIKKVSDQLVDINENNNILLPKDYNGPNMRIKSSTKHPSEPIVLIETNCNGPLTVKQTKKESVLEKQQILFNEKDINISNELSNCNKISEGSHLNSLEVKSELINKVDNDPAITASENGFESVELVSKNETLNGEHVKKIKKKPKQNIKIVDKNVNNNFILFKNNNGPHTKVKRDTRTINKSIVLPENESIGESTGKQTNKVKTSKRQNILFNKNDVLICQDLNNSKIIMEGPSLNSSELTNKVHYFPARDDSENCYIPFELMSKNDTLNIDQEEKPKEAKNRVKTFCKINSDQQIDVNKMSFTNTNKMESKKLNISSDLFKNNTDIKRCTGYPSNLHTPKTLVVRLKKCDEILASMALENCNTTCMKLASEFGVLECNHEREREKKDKNTIMSRNCEVVTYKNATKFVNKHNKLIGMKSSVKHKLKVTRSCNETFSNSILENDFTSLTSNLKKKMKRDDFMKTKKNMKRSIRREKTDIVHCKRKIKNAFKGKNCRVNNNSEDVSVSTVNKIVSDSPKIILKDNCSLNHNDSQTLEIVKNENSLRKAVKKNKERVDYKPTNHVNSKTEFNSKSNNSIIFSSNNITSTNIVPLVHIDVCNSSCTELSSVMEENSEDSRLNKQSGNQIVHLTPRLYSSKKHSGTNKALTNELKPSFNNILQNESVISEGTFTQASDHFHDSMKVQKEKYQRIYCLDGTFDNSSSDENVEETIDNLENIGADCTTPKKRRSSTSKINVTPKTKYVPLCIEIKKSPKGINKPAESQITDVSSSQLTTFTQPVKLCEELSRIDCRVSEGSDPKTVHKTCGFDRKRSRFEPSVKIERLSLPSCSGIPHRGCEVPSHSSAKDPDPKLIHPLVKRLKVSVQRMSLTVQECAEEEVESSEFQLSTSLPVTSKDKVQTTDSVRRIAKEQTTESNDKVGMSSGIDKGKKVRKALIFPNETNVAIPESASTFSNNNLKMPPRKISIDMFESASNPDSSHTESEGLSSDSFTPNLIKLSGESPNLISDVVEENDTFNTSLSDLDFTYNFTLNDAETVNTLEMNVNPLGLSQPKLFTPAFHPPCRSEVLANLKELNLPQVLNDEPFYSDPTDVGKSLEVGSTMLKIRSKSVIHLEEFEGTFSCFSKVKREYCESDLPLSSKSINMTPVFNPPSSKAAKQWLEAKVSNKIVKEIKQSKTVQKIILPSSPKDLGDDNYSDSISLVTLSQSPAQLSGVESNEDCVKSTQDDFGNILGEDVGKIPLMASTPIIHLSKTKGFRRMSSIVNKSLPSIPEEQSIQEMSPQTLHSSEKKVSNTVTLKQMSDSGIKRLLSDSKSPASVSCQIDMATPNNSGNYRMELENLQDVKLNHEYQYLTIMTVELHMHTRAELKPNPDHDAICCIFYNITNDCPDISISHVTGAIYVTDGGSEEKMPQINCQLQPVPDEQSLIAAFVVLVRKWDPDILVGYEIEMLSWGYLLHRAYVLNVNLATELSRVKVIARTDDEPKEITDDDSEIQLTGRIVINLWRFLRHEVALQSYTFENIAYHVLHQRIPLFSFSTLTNWWAHRTKLYRWLVFEHYLLRIEGIVKLMQQLDLVGRTSEFARLFGIQFYDVLSRGSQFRVESMMLRLVKPLNYVAVSPSVQQRARMRAPESLPLIMEPESRFYSDPVIVLDFQSLYPSIIIAYNYCFCTCLGRVEHLGRSEMFEFGCTQLRVPIQELQRVKNNLNFSPCGVAFVNQTIVKGVLPRMLEEILNTRLMVKQSMKEKKDNKTLQRVLHARQLGLKLIANVTYGYTAANFSGRMPCIEVGDSVVSKARETLERAIGMVSQRPEWGARVIYGDTDSMFVLVPGKSREEAFRIGKEIADAVTNDNPKPVKLKLEKVYQPCFLQTKKRYVGYMYESPSQEEPTYDAKGIETVRRDGCPAVAKILEKSLRLLFETKDVSLVKRYVCRQFTKVISCRISTQELTFAREFRGVNGYKPGACVPALQLAKQWLAADPRAVPRVGQRVPYVIVAGPPGLPLIRLVRSPECLIRDPSLKINAEYYISRVIIPPLERCFSLIGANIASWYIEMPRKQLLYLPSTTLNEGKRKATISQYFVTASCVSCQRLTASGVCGDCQQQPQHLAVTMTQRVQHWERTLYLVDKLCQSCCGRPNETECVSMDCPVLYRRSQARRDLMQADYIRSLQLQFLTF